ncbi:MAG: cryptochrome/photolyase family protein [Arenimonas sp.]
MANALVWLRRDLRLSDNTALQAALNAGYSPVLVYIHAPEEEKPWQPGAASLTWLHYSLQSLKKSVEEKGGRLIIRIGASLAELEKLIEQTQAEAVFWNRLYEPACIVRDSKVKEALKQDGVHAESCNGALLVEPWAIKTLGGDPYRVFTPFWKNAVRTIDHIQPTTAPIKLPSVSEKIKSISIRSLKLLPKIKWDNTFWEFWRPGEAGALDLLEAFIDGAANGYKEQRNFPDRIGSSKLSPHLHFGEISPRQILKAIRKHPWSAKAEQDVTHFINELGWREFSHHLLFHYPYTSNQNMVSKFDNFKWAKPDPELLAAWQQGKTGIPIIDAGMRELRATGWMHNRVRMIVASFLCKNLRYHWLEGAQWFWDCLLDADLANNTQGWQWTAGTGADAAQYFRIFNPVSQSEKFDGQGKYIHRWIPELAKLPAPAVFAPWEHAELSKRLAPDYPARPILDLKQSREAALVALIASKNA